MITVTQIHRYPVKGLSPEALSSAALRPGQGLVGDRRFAIAHGSTAIDAATPEWLAKKNFLMLAKNPRLAALTTRWDDATTTLTIERDGRKVASANIGTPIGRTRLSDFLAAYLKDEVRGTPKVIDGGDSVVFSDHDEPVVALLNASSLADLERVAGRPLDMRRFRGNVTVSGPAAWAEFSWIGQEISIGSTRLWVKEKIGRCTATSVDLDTGAVDINVPLTLKKGFGHSCFGVYARVIEGGEIRLGDPVVIHGPAAD